MMYTDSVSATSNASALRQRVQGRSVADALALFAADDPERPLVLLGHQRLSLGEVDAQAGALAGAMSGLGIGAGERIALVLPNGPEFVLALFAAAKLGATVVPLNPRYTPTELQSLLRHSEAAVVFAGGPLEGLRGALPELRHVVTLSNGAGTISFAELLSQSGQAPRVEVDPQEPFAILYTSGMSGQPKGVVLSHTNVLASALGTVDAIGLRGDDVVFGVGALFNSFGLVPGLLGTLLAGASLVLHDGEEPARALDILEREKVTVHHGIPTSFILELREPGLRERKLGQLRTGIVAGAPISEELVVRIQQTLVPGIRVGYGLTETGPLIAVTSPDDPPHQQISTVGRPLPGNEVRVLDPEGAVLPEESVGEIVVRGPGVMSGYFREPGETALAFTEDGFFRTGDLGMVDDEGFLHVLARRKEIIIRGGYNIYPREVEDRLHVHPAVLDVAVVGVPNEVLGEVACACIVPVEGAVVTGPEILDFCRETLADYKVPDLVRFLDALPTTGSGKARRIELARMISAEESSRRP
ncbi:MAG: AMP-binding protein [Gemmatimonadota bacterium]|nr:AMP-binding protein [Gemmatimonadota bacterium]